MEVIEVFLTTFRTSLVPTIPIQNYYNVVKRRLIFYTSLNKVELFSSIICFIIPIIIIVSSSIFAENNDLIHDCYKKYKSIGTKYFGYLLIPILSIMILFYFNLSSSNITSIYQQQFSKKNLSTILFISFIILLIIINNTIELYSFKYLILLNFNLNNKSIFFNFLKYSIIQSFTTGLYHGIKKHYEPEHWIFEKDLPIEEFHLILQILINWFHFFKYITGFI
ncbi:hypothetical protein KGF54_001560 [Candida jiufengensis]|uniref:uncharacterized protein n=1 Tax=Candida jiufengensis TaxID=497108 RepID=UPI0022241E1F|nr:uncharacterized protein KGF54_001560 [Candida jiufengensis]KAI5954999.1 hypothetical protein KGF54_001560 [Candida jiufengensis]